eukprot:scpid75671/ scgid19141/ 
MWSKFSGRPCAYLARQEQCWCQCEMFHHKKSMYASSWSNGPICGGASLSAASSQEGPSFIKTLNNFLSTDTKQVVHCTDWLYKSVAEAWVNLPAYYQCIMYGV